MAAECVPWIVFRLRYVTGSLGVVLNKVPELQGMFQPVV